ncbi:MAG: hypothetical protein SP4CHLAM5_07260 [Chlamydiia bacterium]|nr:hypothetical protein [Chlamydiia bacterium]MCH9618593.1 hypothetical protein [Chlamydiia bacterium]MCH9623868.1 hypothetical protein [Chlamydiia bacterium]
MKYIKFYCLLLMYLPCYATTDLFIVSIPKSGTHLIEKFFLLLEEKCVGYDYKQQVFHPGLSTPISRIWEESLEIIETSKRKKLILNIRDLRDCYCSAVPFIDKLMEADPNIYFYNIMKGFEGFDEKLKHFLREDVKFPWNYVPVFEEARKFSLLENVFLVRFEDLIGEDKEAQRNLIKDLIDYLEVECSDEAITEIQDDLFGPEKVLNGELYFHEGKTGKWKTMFTEEHKRMFKERAGEYLIFFGYEKDSNW